MAEKLKAQQKALEAKVTQLLDELSRREAYVRSEEAKLSHLEALSIELQDKALALTRREEAVLTAEVKQGQQNVIGEIYGAGGGVGPITHLATWGARSSNIHAKEGESASANQQGMPHIVATEEQSSLMNNGDVEPSLRTTQGNSVLESQADGEAISESGSGWATGTTAAIARREQRVSTEEARVARLQAALLQERAEFQALRQEFEKNAAEQEEALASQREELRQMTAALHQEADAMAARQEEFKSRDEERDVYTRLVHDLEVSEERVRRTLLATQDDYHTKIAALDVEREAFQAESDELRQQWKEYDRSKNELVNAQAEVADERTQLHAWQGSLQERERQLNELSDQLSESRKQQEHASKRLADEREEVAALLRRNEAISHEAAVDAARAEDANQRAANLHSEIAEMQRTHAEQMEYLAGWGCELQGREDEMARLIEFVVGLPKSHSSTEIQNMNAGLLQHQHKRLSENYASGQRRRVQSATATRFGRGALAAVSAFNMQAHQTPSMSSHRRPDSAVSSRMSAKSKLQYRDDQNITSSPPTCAVRSCSQSSADSVVVGVTMATSQAGDDTLISRIDSGPSNTTKKPLTSTALTRLLAGPLSRASPTEKKPQGRPHNPPSDQNQRPPSSPTASRRSPLNAQAMVRTDVLPQQLQPSKRLLLLQPIRADASSSKRPASAASFLSAATSHHGDSNRSANPISSSPAITSVETGIAAESRIVTLLRAIDAQKRTFTALAARAKLLDRDRDEAAVEAYFQRMSPQQRVDVQVAILRERDFASELGLRQQLMQCPFGVDPSVEPKVMVTKMAQWWKRLGEHMVATDERSLEARMSVLERGLSALRAAQARARCTERGEEEVAPKSTSSLQHALHGMSDTGDSTTDAPTKEGGTSLIAKQTSYSTGDTSGEPDQVVAIGINRLNLENVAAAESPPNAPDSQPSSPTASQSDSSQEEASHGSASVHKPDVDHESDRNNGPIGGRYTASHLMSGHMKDEGGQRDDESPSSSPSSRTSSSTSRSSSTRSSRRSGPSSSGSSGPSSENSEDDDDRNHSNDGEG